MILVSISQNTRKKIGEVELTHPDEVKDIVFKAKTVQKKIGFFANSKKN